jgi:hypothetical protein
MWSRTTELCTTEVRKWFAALDPEKRWTPGLSTTTAERPHRPKLSLANVHNTPALLASLFSWAVVHICMFVDRNGSTASTKRTSVKSKYHRRSTNLHDTEPSFGRCSDFWEEAIHQLVSVLGFSASQEPRVVLCPTRNIYRRLKVIPLDYAH